MAKRIYVRGPLSLRFWAHVQKGEGCWEYTGARGTFGYGSVNVGDRRYEGAHRVAWLLLRGPIPAGEEVCHSCDNPPCCNPAHLFLGTHGENMRDMMEKARGGGQFQRTSHCKRGHEFTPVNTELRRHDGARLCRECRRADCRRRRATTRAARVASGWKPDEAKVAHDKTRRAAIRDGTWEPTSHFGTCVDAERFR